MNNQIDLRGATLTQAIIEDFAKDAMEISRRPEPDMLVSADIYATLISAESYAKINKSDTKDEKIVKVTAAIFSIADDEILANYSAPKEKLKTLLRQLIKE